MIEGCVSFAECGRLLGERIVLPLTKTSRRFCGALLLIIKEIVGSGMASTFMASTVATVTIIT